MKMMISNYFQDIEIIDIENPDQTENILKNLNFQKISKNLLHANVSRHKKNSPPPLFFFFSFSPSTIFSFIVVFLTAIK